MNEGVLKIYNGINESSISKLNTPFAVTFKEHKETLQNLNAVIDATIDLHTTLVGKIVVQSGLSTELDEKRSLLREMEAFKVSSPSLSHLQAGCS